MKKAEAIQKLGGTISAAAEAIGVSYQAVNQWPDVLPARLIDRVQAALYRQHIAQKTKKLSEKEAPIPERAPTTQEVSHA